MDVGEKKGVCHTLYLYICMYKYGSVPLIGVPIGAARTEKYEIYPGGAAPMVPAGEEGLGVRLASPGGGGLRTPDHI